jgi:Tfp pilus assembly protein PilF
MEWCRSLVLTVGLAACGAGCVSTPVHNATPPERVTAADVAAHKDTAEGKRQRASTEVAFGTFKVREATNPKPNPPLMPAQKEQMLEQARVSFERAQKLDPSYLPAYGALGNLYSIEGDYARAVAEYQKGLTRDAKDASLWLDLGICHCRQKSWPQAVVCLQKAHELDPANRAYTKALGLTLAAASHGPEAVPLLTQILGPAEAQCAVARMCHRLGQDDQCRQHLQLALQLDPSLAGARDLQARLDHPPGRTAAPSATLGFEAADPIVALDSNSRE